MWPHGVLAALNRGPLEDLHIEFRSSGYHPNLWDWSTLELPQLTRLVLEDDPDSMGDVAQAKMPMLRVCSLPFNEYKSSESAINAFATAFPQIRALQLVGSQDEGFLDPPPHAVIEALGRVIVPMLESFDWYTWASNSGAILRSLTPKERVGEAPRWPRPRTLKLQYAIPKRSKKPKIQARELFYALPRAASHSPGLTSFQAVIDPDLPSPYHHHPYHTPLAVVESFAATAKKTWIWPLLRVFCTRYALHQNGAVVETLRQTWPGLTVENAAQSCYDEECLFFDEFC